MLISTAGTADPCWKPSQSSPKEDAMAAKLELELGLTSRKRILNSLGWSETEVSAEIAADPLHPYSNGSAPRSPQESSK